MSGDNTLSLDIHAKRFGGRDLPWQDKGPPSGRAAHFVP